MPQNFTYDWTQIGSKWRLIIRDSQTQLVKWADEALTIEEVVSAAQFDFYGAIRPDAFAQMCRSFTFSDMTSEDSSTWRRARHEYELILHAANKLPRAIAVEIYNSIVESKLTDPAQRAEHYWE